MKVYTDRILARLAQLKDEIVEAHHLTYYERLWAFKNYCQTTCSLATCLAKLPQSSYDLEEDSLYLTHPWPVDAASYAYRWQAIIHALDGYSKGKDLILMQAPSRSASLTASYSEFTKIFVIPLYNYLVDHIETSSNMLYLLLRYKRWVEWFETKRLRSIYQQATGNGETLLDSDLRRFLFESGIDYPFSQPRSPGGQVDIVAGLETDDPLVLEVKIWDSTKGYRVNRVRDGLRQVVDYAAKYGKDSGYVVVFNLDPEPLVFVGATNASDWPARIESGSTYYFVAVDICQREKPISQQDKGKPVGVNKVQLSELWDSVKSP